MADDWHVKWLAEGVKKWNKRRKKVEFRPDLSGIRFFDLLPWDFRDSPKSSRYFEKIDLSDANLVGADLSDLNFSRANFQKSDLKGAKLSLSNFNRADFSRARLDDVDAFRATLVEALLIEVSLTGAKLEGVDARGAILVESLITESQVSSLADKRIQSYPSLAAYSEEVRRSSFDLPREASSLEPTAQMSKVEASPPDSVHMSFGHGRISMKASPEESKTPKNKYDVFFGTNRSPVLERGALVGFGDGTDRETSYGVCEVIVPEGHRIGSIGSPLWKRLWNRSDDRLRVDSIISLNSELFWEHLRQTAARMVVRERPTIFVHGYNTSFVDATLRAAQIGYDLGIGQGVGLFSWPSRGSARDYLADEAAAEASKYSLADFIEGFVQHSQNEGVNIIAHSMGCRCLMNSIEVLSNGRRKVLSRVGQVVLAAADIDANIMPNLGRFAVSHCARTTSYVCGEDLALRVSGWLHGYSRIGFRPPTFVLGGMDTVVVNDANLGDFSHGYIGTSRAVLNDVFALLKSNVPPAERFSLKKVDEDGLSFWRIET